MRGITLLAVGNPTYMYFAVNQMISIKTHSKLPIQLICSRGLIEHVPEHERLYNELTIIEDEDYIIEGRLNPGKAKVNLYKYYIYDETLYLDVDGIVLKDPLPLFDTKGFYKVQRDAMHWADDNLIRKHFNLSKDFNIYGLNSSLQLVRKCKESEKIYSDAAKAMENPLAMESQDNEWFGWYPDELYFSIGIGNADIDPYFNPPYPIYFRTRMDYGAPLKPQTIIDNHYAMGCFGGDRYNHRSIGKMYDKLVNNWSCDLLQRNIRYKFYELMGRKH